MLPFIFYNFQALVHLLSAADGAEILIENERKKSQNLLTNQFDSTDVRKEFKQNEQSIGSNECNKDKEEMKSNIVPINDTKEVSQGIFSERPVITFNNNVSHLQLSPQRDVQVSWTVEFWLKREDSSISESASDAELESGPGSLVHPSQSSASSVAQSSQQQNASAIRNYALALSEGLAMGLGLERFGNLPPSSSISENRPLQSILGSRSLNSITSAIIGSSSQSQSQVPLAKLSRILGSDFGILGPSTGSSSGPSLWGWDQERGILGQERNLGDEREENEDDEESERGDDDNENGDDDGNQYGRIDCANRGEHMAESSWTLIPPGAAADPLHSMEFEPSNVSDDETSNMIGFQSCRGKNPLSVSQQDVYENCEESVLNSDVRKDANRALLAILEKITGFESFDRNHLSGTDEVDGRELGIEFSKELGRIEGGDAIDQLLSDQVKQLAGTGPGLLGDTSRELEVESPGGASGGFLRQFSTAARSSASGSVSTCGRRRNSLIAKENEGAKDEEEGAIMEEKMRTTESETKKEDKKEDKKEEKKEEKKEKEKDNILPPIYLLLSSSGHIKLQTGGKVFKDNDVDDPQQEKNPISSQAYCISIGQRGASEKSFDYILPKKKWIHLSITCSVGGHSSSSSSSSSSSVVSIYENGELKDSQNMRCNLPIGTFGVNKKSQTFQGQLGEMRIWNYARTALEIKRDLYTDVTGKYVQLYGQLNLFDFFYISYILFHGSFSLYLIIFPSPLSVLVSFYENQFHSIDEITLE